ncbi:DUF262 domain-containing protein [Acinetobacter lactucae]|uniref:DUF262 domain-containing protein n=1 Tax=Acinetobacter lactucae TaxID=1785128 RepID=A0AB35K2I3_9GAMM|nr:DUF262 domain-containing protein [Acinetobacter lactucae]MDD9316199.1 DUF262 domain-containing protein [Acinetobacter lactucae]MDD9320354.1 DUF262 domain-containing protein [Acinetobacter lactucae]
MGYSTLSIREVTRQIEQNKVFLPALQRKFVWKKEQIERLFDSIMRGYPIGAFLFWELDAKVAKDYVFYEFLKDYDERTPYNRRKEGAFSHEQIIGVLDGQQRLSSMYIGFNGFHKTKNSYAWKSNPNAYPEKRLYLDLLNLPYVTESGEIKLNEAENYPFSFLTEKESQKLERKIEDQIKPCYWFKVGDSLYWDKDEDIEVYYQTLASQIQSIYQDQKTFLEAWEQHQTQVLLGLKTLHARLHDEKLISYFQVRENDLENILKIFVRVNSGGTILSKTDLLFSTVVATWSAGRDKIEKLNKDINQFGKGFKFGNEFLMRACLYLTDLDVKYKVNSFKAENVEKIKNSWEKIQTVLNQTVRILDEFGYSGEHLPSQNALLPIVYHLYKGGQDNDTSKKQMLKYLVHANVKQIFGSSQESVLQDLRRALRSKNEDGTYSLKHTHFDFEVLKTTKLSGGKSLFVTDENIEDVLNREYGAITFNILVLLNPDFRLRDVTFAQDHIHPKSKFNKIELSKAGIPLELHQKYIDLKDTLPNLQLMNGHWNSGKNDKLLMEWFAEQSKADQEAIKLTGLYPNNVSLTFSEFLTFHEKRKELLKEQLYKALDIKKVMQNIEVGEVV